MLKTILFGFMDTGYASLRELVDRCKVNIRGMYLMGYETPSSRAFSYFINEEIKESAQDVLKAVMSYTQIEEKRTCPKQLFQDRACCDLHADKKGLYGGRPAPSCIQYTDWSGR